MDFDDETLDFMVEGALGASMLGEDRTLNPRPGWECGTVVTPWLLP